MSLHPALGRRYRVHATASHAQDCPDWGQKNIFPSSRVAISVCILFQAMLSLRSWPGVMVHMLWHYTHETVLTGARRYIFIMSVYKYIFYSRKLFRLEAGESPLSIITVKMYFFQKCLPSPVLARRYSVYATAFIRTRLSWLGVWRDRPSPGKVEGSLLYSRKQFLWSWSSVVVLMPRHLHAQYCPDCGPEINICTCIYKSM